MFIQKLGQEHKSEKRNRKNPKNDEGYVNHLEGGE